MGLSEFEIIKLPYRVDVYIDQPLDRVWVICRLSLVSSLRYDHHR